MHDWVSEISKNFELAEMIVQDLNDIGFIIIPSSVKSKDLMQLANAYDSVVSLATSDDKKIGSSTTRVNDLVNRGKGEFDSLYIQQPLLEASYRVIGQPFKLSTMLGRTLHPNSQASQLHIDFKPDEKRFPMVCFIFMVDEFRNDNGATRFVPTSHKWSTIPNELTNEALAEIENQTVSACGQAGSIIIFNGSIWHGHSANLTNAPRRSIQGAFIPRNAQSGTDFSNRISLETLNRISPLAKYILAI